MSAGWLVAIVPLVVWGQGLPRTEEIVGRIRDVQLNTDFRAQGRLTVDEPDGRRRVSDLAVVRKRLPTGTNLVWNAGRTKLLAIIHPGAPAQVWLQREPQLAAKPMPASQWSEPFLASEFSLEDLVEDHFTWTQQSLLRSEPYGARQCWVVRSQPGSGDSSQYAMVTSWVDRKLLLPVRVLKQARGGGPDKEFLTLGFREVGGKWVANGVEARREGRRGGSRIVFTRGNPQAQVKAAEVDPKAVFRQQEQ